MEAELFDSLHRLEESRKRLVDAVIGQPCCQIELSVVNWNELEYVDGGDNLPWDHQPAQGHHSDNPEQRL
jgi:hypothetical protein